MKREQISEGSMGRRSRLPVLLVIILAIIAVYLFTDHRAQLFGVLPYLLLLACPLVHLLMHRGPRWERWRPYVERA